MTDRRDPERKLLSDVKRAKLARDAALARVALQAEVMREMQAELIAARLRGRLLRIEDFQTFIGVKAVIGADGRIDYRELDLRVRDLVRRRPELADPADNMSNLG